MMDKDYCISNKELSDIITMCRVIYCIQDDVIHKADRMYRELVEQQSKKYDSDRLKSIIIDFYKICEYNKNNQNCSVMKILDYTIKFLDMNDCFRFWYKCQNGEISGAVWAMGYSYKDTLNKYLQNIEDTLLKGPSKRKRAICKNRGIKYQDAWRQYYKMVDKAFDIQSKADENLKVFEINKEWFNIIKDLQFYASDTMLDIVTLRNTTIAHLDSEYICKNIQFNVQDNIDLISVNLDDITFKGRKQVLEALMFIVTHQITIRQVQFILCKLFLLQYQYQTKPLQIGQFEKIADERFQFKAFDCKVKIGGKWQNVQGSSINMPGFSLLSLNPDMPVNQNIIQKQFETIAQVIKDDAGKKSD